MTPQIWIKAVMLCKDIAQLIMKLLTYTYYIEIELINMCWNPYYYKNEKSDALLN
jgi:hypothetical protein